DIMNPFFAELAVGIESLLDEADYAVLLTNTSEQLSKQNRLLEVMHEFQVDGVLLCPVEDTPVDAIERLRRWELPVVLVARYLANVDVDYVGGDNVRGAQMAVDHLVDRGHGDIAFLGGPAHSSARADRLSGFRAALTRHGLHEVAAPRASGTTRDGGHDAMMELLDETDAVTAVLCYNDVVAMGAMLALRARGLEPGKDIAVVGFDDIADASLWRPSLS
ncbi:MAG: substrate-binding domain-containing protein, partial [Rhodothermales bacterium]